MSNWINGIIKIAGRAYPFKVDKEEAEESIRKAGKSINDILYQIKQHYSEMDEQDLLAMAALQFAKKTIELEDSKAGSTEQVDRLKQINEQVDMFLTKYTSC